MFSALHVLAHLVASSPAVALWTQIDTRLLNTCLGCASHEAKFGPFANASRVVATLSSDTCPLAEPISIDPMGFHTTAIGIPGFAVTVVIGAAAWTGRKAYRQTNLDRFFYIHVITIYAWPVHGTSIVRGATQRLGFGIPLILAVAALPMLIMAFWDAIVRRI